MNIAIIGAGAVGLTAGHRLAAGGHHVDVYDSRSGIGGLTGTVQIGGTPIERIYHHVFTSDGHILALLDELGLGADMEWHSPKSGLYLHRGLHPFSGPMDLLRFPELPFHQRISMGLLVLRARFIKNWQALEHTSARDWLIRHAGQAVYDRIWGPLIRSKFDKDADDISAVWIWNKFKLRGSTRGKDVAAEAFGYLKGSYGRLYDALAMRIQEQGGKLRMGETVTKLHPLADGGFHLSTNSMPDKRYDCVLMTGSPEQLMAMAGDALSPEYMTACRQMCYKANLCVMLELDTSLSPYYWITIADEDVPFVLVIEHTNLVPAARYGTHIAYLSRYLDASDPLFSASDEMVEERFLKGLETVFPAFSRSSVKRIHLERERFAQPVVGLQHGAKIPSTATSIPGLFLASMAQIYPEDRGQNYAVRMGEEAAQRIIGSIR